jgi:hypothetical protein
MHNTSGTLHYREVVVLDFEFTQPDGERPEPLCLVASELKSGRVHLYWRDDLRQLAGPQGCSTLNT